MCIKKITFSLPMASSMNKISDQNDQELLSAAIAETEPVASSTLFNRYLELVYGVCLKYMGNRADAQDELMHVYELFVKKIKVHDVENVKSWLYVLSKNHCLGVLRKLKRDTEKFDQFAVMYSEEEYHPLDREENERTLERLEKCIEGLNEMQGACVKAFYYEKKTYDEIATILKIDWNKIRSNIQNGRRNLKNCMEGK